MRELRKSNGAKHFFLAFFELFRYSNSFASSRVCESRQAVKTPKDPPIPRAHGKNAAKPLRRDVLQKRDRSGKSAASPNGAERLRAMIEASVDCVITIDAKSRILEFNAAAERTFGYRREEVIGNPLTEAIIPPGLREGHQRGMAALLQGGAPKLLGKRIEMPAMRSDGSEFPVELTVTRIASQSPPLFTAYLRDITERKRDEQKLRESERKYRALVELTHDLVWAVDTEGRITYMSPASRRIYGREPEEMIGRLYTDFVPPEEASPGMARLAEIIATGESVFEVEARVYHRDGHEVVLSANAVVQQDAAGNIVGLTGTSRDITQNKREEEKLRESETRFRELAENIREVFWLSDPEDTRMIYISPAYETIWGRSRETLYASPASWMEAIHPADKERMLQARANRASTDPHDNIYRIVRPDGSMRWIRDRGFPVRDGEGAVVRFAGIAEDITERERTAEATAQLAAIVESSADAIIGMDLNGIITSWNRGAQKTFGYTAEEMVGGPIKRLISPDRREEEEQVFSRIRRGENVEHFETAGIEKGGSQIELSLTVSPIRNAAGGIAGASLVARDITGLKRTQDALRASEERFRELAENIHEVFWISTTGFGGASSELLYISPAYESVFGRTCESLFRNPHSFLDAIHPEDRARVTDVFEREREQGFEVEYRVVRPDGSIRWIRDRGFPIQDTAGHFYRLAGIAEDISERKQAEDRLRRSEEKFKTLFGIAPVGISVLDQQLNVVDANPALERILRLSKEELLGGTWRGRVYLDAKGTRQPREEMPSLRAVAARRSFNDVETGIIAENGEIIWTQVSAAPLDLPDASAVVITQDITERKRAAKELEQANRQLRILSRQLFHLQEEERRHLARELHDEIGQSLTAAKINLKLIAPDVPAQISGRLEDSVQLLDRLLRQVRELSLNLRPPLLDELGLVPTLRWLVDQQAQRAGLRVIFTANVDGLEIDPDVQTTCFRVAQEAITNIIRHSGAKCFTVDLRREPVRLTLSVRDDGVGFDPAVMQQRTTQDFTLGLVSMKERALLVHGGLEVHSAPGQGTEIHAWFPLPNGEHPATAETA